MSVPTSASTKRPRLSCEALNPFAPGVIERYPARKETRVYLVLWAVFRLAAVSLWLGLVAGTVFGWGQGKGWW